MMGISICSPGCCSWSQEKLSGLNWKYRETPLMQEKLTGIVFLGVRQLWDVWGWILCLGRDGKRSSDGSSVCPLCPAGTPVPLLLSQSGVGWAQPREKLGNLRVSSAAGLPGLWERMEGVGMCVQRDFPPWGWLCSHSSSIISPSVQDGAGVCCRFPFPWELGKGI